MYVLLLEGQLPYCTVEGCLTFAFNRVLRYWEFRVFADAVRSPSVWKLVGLFPNSKVFVEGLSRLPTGTEELQQKAKQVLCSFP